MKSLSAETLTEKLNPGFVTKEGNREGEIQTPCRRGKGIWLLKPEPCYRPFSDRD